MRRTIETNPEFASEIVLSIPYAYWLHENNMLEKVSTCKGMKPFYYFCDNVDERFEFRSLDNAQALKDIPNKWLHNSEAGGGRNGVIDYTQWTCPPYRKHFKNDLFDHLKPYIVVNNIFNIEPNGQYVRFFDIKNLYEIFNYLTKTGYNVIYKRPENTEFALDQNEYQTLNSSFKLHANVEGKGEITDYQLVDMMDNVYNINELNYKEWDYSTLNLKVFAETDGFISVHGGGVQLCACYGKPVIIYTNTGKGLRPGYIENEDSYIKKLSNAPVYHVKDPIANWEKNGGRDYKSLMKVVQDTFIGWAAESILRAY